MKNIILHSGRIPGYILNAISDIIVPDGQEQLIITIDKYEVTIKVTETGNIATIKRKSTLSYFL